MSLYYCCNKSFWSRLQCLPMYFAWVANNNFKTEVRSRYISVKLEQNFNVSCIQIFGLIFSLYPKYEWYQNYIAIYNFVYLKSGLSNSPKHSITRLASSSTLLLPTLYIYLCCIIKRFKKAINRLDAFNPSSLTAICLQERISFPAYMAGSSFRYTYGVRCTKRIQKKN